MADLDPAHEAKRAELLGWIAKTRAAQKRLGIAVGAAAVIAFGLMFWNGAVGGVTLAITAIVAMCGFWITGGHIMDWRNRLTEVGKPKVLRISGGGRRF